MTEKPDPSAPPPAPTRRSKLMGRALLIALGLLALAYAAALIHATA